MAELTPLEVARTYWALPPEKRQWSEVAQLLGRNPKDKVLQNRLGRLARQWEEKGLVRHVVVSEPSRHEYMPRDPELEQDLRRQFRLRQAVVVDVPMPRPEGGAPADVAVHDQADNEVHEALGRWAARVFASLMRQHDVLGVGGGRGPYFTVKNCLFPGGLPNPRKVVSLTGQMSANVWGDAAKTEIASMDADQVASLLGGQLGASSIIRVNKPIADARSRPLEIPKAVTLALVGIGALAGGHRMRRYDECQELAPVKGKLKELCELADKLDRKTMGEEEMSPHWVADLCNHLFITKSGPNDWGKVPVADREKLEERVNKLNAGFRSPDESQFADVCRRGAVVAVGGGKHKVGGIYHVLMQKNPLITHLITDRSVARQIVDLSKRPANVSSVQGT